MIRHIELGATPVDRSLRFRALYRRQLITLGGNSKLKIYGTLRCSSGKKMQTVNRVFFRNEKEALAASYRPCGHCLRTAYQTWKNKYDEPLS